MTEPTLKSLKEFTELFFKLHWNIDELGDAPQWSDIDTRFRPIPNYNKQGVYAFIKGCEITYIGVGASKVGGKYSGNGLSDRVMKYCRWIDKANDHYGPVDKRLVDAGAIVTIGFEPNQAYLAYALEMYLILKMQPIHNKVGRC